MVFNGEYQGRINEQLTDINGVEKYKAITLF